MKANITGTVGCNVPGKPTYGIVKLHTKHKNFEYGVINMDTQCIPQSKHLQEGMEVTIHEIKEGIDGLLIIKMTFKETKRPHD